MLLRAVTGRPATGFVCHESAGHDRVMAVVESGGNPAGDHTYHDFSGLPERRDRGTGRKTPSEDGAHHRISAGWILVVVLVGVGGVYLYGTSVPGELFEYTFMSMLALGVLAVVFAVRVVVALLQGGREGRWFPRWLWAALAIGLVLAVAVLSSAPLRLRFAGSRSEFDVAAREILGSASPESAAERFDDAVVGSYEIIVVDVVAEGVLFYDSNGNFWDDAGFGYFPDDRLPKGNGNFENPQYRSLGDHWYAWTASW